MILNIIDRRKRKHRWLCINAIIEDTWHDNSNEDADQAPDDDPKHEVLYDQREGISLSEAVEWAMEKKAKVTLFLYDEGMGTNLATRAP